MATPPEDDRAWAIGNMHKKSGEVRSCYASEQTDRQTDILITTICTLPGDGVGALERLNAQQPPFITAKIINYNKDN